MTKEEALTMREEYIDSPDLDSWYYLCGIIDAYECQVPHKPRTRSPMYMMGWKDCKEDHNDIK